MKPLVRWLLLPALVLPAGCFGPNQYEKQADTVTKAVIANDMRPVEKDFNAVVWPKLEDRGKVGQLSQELNNLGTFKGVKEEQLTNAAPARAHKFVATFDKGQRTVCMLYDPVGKIQVFDVHSSPQCGNGN
jgi:hypothetical protein